MFLACTCIALTTSCEKDDPNTTPQINSTLDNTTWIQTETVDFMGGVMEIELRIDFESNKTFVFAVEMSSSDYPDIAELESSSLSGTWEYEEPMVYMTVEGETITAEIKDDKLYIYEDMYGYGFNLVLSKQ